MTIKNDAAESAFVGSQLEAINAKMFKTDFPELKWRQFIPVNNNVPAGAETYSYDEMTPIGGDECDTKGHTYSDDAPMVDVKVARCSSKIIPVTRCFEYNIQDVRAGMLSGMNLPDQKAMAAREAIERQLDYLACFGSESHGTEGFLNNSDVPYEEAVTNGTGTTWAVKDIDERIEDILTSLGTMRTDTNGVEGNMVDLILPPAQYLLLCAERIPETGMTGLDYVKTSLPVIRSISQWHRLVNAGVGGAHDRAVLYVRDPNKVEAIVPLELSAMPPELRSFRWITNLEARFGGVVFYKPLSAFYLDQI